MLKIAVIADDLTGAADTGVLFVPVVDEMRLLNADQFQNRAPGVLSGLALCTDTRSMPPAEAGEVVFNLSGRLAELQPDLIYKKIDSCLRGHVGVELLGLLKACGRRAALVAPAYPRLGRSTVADVHYVLGVPVSESEAGQDPVRPVTSSRLTENLGRGVSAKVGHICLETVRGGEASLAQAISGLLEQNARLIAVDAATDDDLRRIAAAARAGFPDLILSGSAGLAEAIAGCLFRQDHKEPAREAPAFRFNLDARPTLLVGGSASAVLRAQLDRLAASAHFPLQILEAGQVLHGLSGEDRAALSRRLGEGSLIICLSPPEQGRERLPSRDLALALGKLAADLVSDHPHGLSALFASGGDTAQAVLDMLGNPEVVVHCQLAPGFIVSTLATGPATGLFFLTKSGSFGGPEMLAEVFARLLPSVNSATSPVVADREPSPQARL